MVVAQVAGYETADRGRSLLVIGKRMFALGKQYSPGRSGIRSRLVWFDMSMSLAAGPRQEENRSLVSLEAGNTEMRRKCSLLNLPAELALASPSFPNGPGC